MQLSARTPTAECVGQVKSITFGEAIKRSFTSFMCIFFLFYALNVSYINYISTVYMMCELI